MKGEESGAHAHSGVLFSHDSEIVICRKMELETITLSGIRQLRRSQVVFSVRGGNWKGKEGGVELMKIKGESRRPAWRGVGRLALLWCAGLAVQEQVPSCAQLQGTCKRGKRKKRIMRRKHKGDRWWRVLALRAQRGRVQGWEETGHPALALSGRAWSEVSCGLSTGCQPEASAALAWGRPCGTCTPRTSLLEPGEARCVPCCPPCCPQGEAWTSTLSWCVSWGNVDRRRSIC